MNRFTPSIQARDLFNNGHIDYICTGCLVIVEDPKAGCPRCRIKNAKKKESLETFLKQKAERDSADLI